MTAKLNSHRYLSCAAAALTPPAAAGDRFELEESDVWGADVAAVAGAFLEPKMAARRRPARRRAADHPARSLPVNIPDWSKILGGEWRRRAAERDDDFYECDDVEEENDRIAPHEYLARNRGASFSVHEGEGRTLKGRDLSRVRNAIWKQIGFED